MGLDAWYTTIESTSLTTNGFAYGIELEDSTLNADVGAFINERNEVFMQLMHQIGTATTAQQYGLVLSDSSVVIVDDWTANLHNTPLLLEDGSVAHARNFVPLNTAQGSSDAVGEGTSCGGPSTSGVSTNDSGYL